VRRPWATEIETFALSATDLIETFSAARANFARAERRRLDAEFHAACHAVENLRNTIFTRFSDELETISTDRLRGIVAHGTRDLAHWFPHDLADTMTQMAKYQLEARDRAAQSVQEQIAELKTLILVT